MAQWLACWAHNPKVRGSKPRSAISIGHFSFRVEFVRAQNFGMCSKRWRVCQKVFGIFKRAFSCSPQFSINFAVLAINPSFFLRLLLRSSHSSVQPPTFRFAPYCIVEMRISLQSTFIVAATCRYRPVKGDTTFEWAGLRFWMGRFLSNLFQLVVLGLGPSCCKECHCRSLLLATAFPATWCFRSLQMQNQFLQKRVAKHQVVFRPSWPRLHLQVL